MHNQASIDAMLFTWQNASIDTMLLQVPKYKTIYSEKCSFSFVKHFPLIILFYLEI